MGAPPSSSPPGGGKWLGYLGAALLIAGVWGIEWWVIPHTDFYVTNIVLKIGYNLLAVMGLSLVLGFTGQFSLGHAGFMAVGAYTAGALSLYTGMPPMLATAIGGLAAALAGVAVGLPSLRLVGDYLAVVTLGFNGIIIVLIQNTPVLGGAQGLIGLPVATTFATTWTWVVLGGLFIRNVLASSTGRALRAVRDNEIATRSLGINTTRTKVVAFVVGAFWAGVAGALVGFLNSSLFPAQFQYDRSIELVAMVVLGGTGSLSGPLIAGAVLTALPELLRPIAEYRMVIYSMLLIIMMIVRPQGLLGNHEISDLIPWRRLRARPG